MAKKSTKGGDAPKGRAAKGKAAAGTRGAKPAAARAGKKAAPEAGRRGAAKAVDTVEAKAARPVSSKKRHPLAQKGDIIAKAEGATVALAGDKSHGLYHVDAGRAHVRLTTAERVFILESLGEGDLFYYSGGPGLEGGTVDIQMLRPTELSFTPTGRLQAQIKKSGDSATQLLELQQKRTEAYVSRLRDLALGTTDYRLAKFLYDQIPESMKDSRKSVSVQLEVSREEIAALIGTVREVVSRGLSKLVSDGVIKKQGRNFSVLKLKELKKRAELK